MNIEHVGGAFKAQIAKKVNSASKKAPSATPQPKDQVSLSPDSKALSQTQSSVSTVKTVLRNSPEIRVEKVEQAKQRVENGFYNTPQFAAQLAEKLISDFNIF